MNLSLLLRYGTAGAFGAFVQTSTLYVWVSVARWQETYLLGAVVGFLLALITTFLLQKYWTFRDHALHRTREQLFWYSMVALLNVSINVVCLALIKEFFVLIHQEFFHIWYLIAQVGIVGLASGVSFILNYFFTFRSVRNRIEESLESSPLV